MTCFYKVSGAGNDFIALVEPVGESKVDPDPASIRAWCRRGLSLGADGVMMLRRREAGAVSMVHWNADGGRSDLCLNGSRCAVRLAVELGWDSGSEVELFTDAGPLSCRPSGADEVEIALPFEMGKARSMELGTPNGNVMAHYLVVGVPHLVVMTPEDPAEIDLEVMAPPLRSHARLGEAGANVNFVQRLSKEQVRLRTFERGVEGETLACGTGAVAAARVGVELGELEWPVGLLCAGGFELRVGEWRGRTTLTGDARIVAKGELLDGSLG